MREDNRKTPLGIARFPLIKRQININMISISLLERFLYAPPQEKTKIMEATFFGVGEREAFELRDFLTPEEQEELVPSFMWPGVDEDAKIDGEIKEARLYGDHA